MTISFYVFSYVDDIFVIENNNKIIKFTKDMLNSIFNIKSMGLTDRCNSRNKNLLKGLILSQSHYVDKIFKKFNKNNTTMTQTLIDTNQHL